MKKVSDFLYKNQSYAIAPLNNQQSPATEAPVIIINVTSFDH